jgi:hypothetical protein
MSGETDLQTFSVQLSRAEREVLGVLAARDGRRPGQFLRQLLLREALAASPPLPKLELLPRPPRPRKSDVKDAA